MADKKQAMNYAQAANMNAPASAAKIDALYNWLSYDLQKIKSELVNELKLSSVQVSSLCDVIQSDKESNIQAVSQELRYGYKQNQTIYEDLAKMLTDMQTRLDELASEDMAAEIGKKIDEMLQSVTEKEDVPGKFEQFEKALEEIHIKAVEAVTMMDDVKAVADSLMEKTDECVAEHSRKVIEAVAAVPVAENVDYARIVDEVGDRVLEIFGDVLAQHPEQVVAAEETVEETPVEEKTAEVQPVEAKVDYEKIIYGTAEKVVESLPYPEKVDYRRIEDSFAKTAEKVQVGVSEDVIAAAVAAAVEKAVSALNIDAIAEAVAARIQIPEPIVPEVPEIDYDKLSDMVVEKLSANVDQTYDVVLDETGITELADKLADRLAGEDCEDEEETTFNFVIDDEGIDAIATRVAEQLCTVCVPCEAPVEEVVEETVEETAEEVVEEPVEEVVEEVVEETVEEPVEEVVEEVVEETASEEIAVAAEPVYDEVGDDLIDAETGMVVRLKKSFTAKMRQSEGNVKEYYSMIKNELTSYKKINSNVSWHGDRFNFGRETVAKIGITGKTLCLYLALDPENPEFKQTVYHQKNVGHQKAYENTPFMVKVKSDAAAKKAVRLAIALAEKLQTEKKENYKEVNYVKDYAYQSTKKLLADGFIKMTKEKKVALDF